MSAAARAGDRLSEGLEEPAPKRTKRSYVACYRCHSHKVKCSGGLPCRRCHGTDTPEACSYPTRDRRVVVSESYLKELEANSRQGACARENHQDDNAETRNSPENAESRAPSQGVQTDPDVANPLHETPVLYHLDRDLRQQFIGESTSTAFGNRLLQCLHPQDTAMPLPSDTQFVTNPVFARQMGKSTDYKLPGRICANLLVRTALRFIGQVYHFLFRHEFLQQLEEAYAVSKGGGEYDSAWACKFFAVLALGELYAGSSVSTSSSGVPGTNYFLTAVALLQDQYDEPTVAQVEIMLLLYFYSHALGRVMSAHVYSGLALRYSTSLGLHRSQAANPLLKPVEREHRIRLWWTSYCFDRSTCSRLGQPLTIRDDDVNVEMPSMDSLSSEDQEKFCSPAHLIANIELARIEGLIMRNIYGISSSAHGSFVHNVRMILNKLRQWDSKVPASLRLSQGASNRPLASLQLHFNECIILTTRPVVLHVLKAKNPFMVREATRTKIQALSETALTLAESCLSAARTTNSIMAQLYVENSLAIFGYFDAHHLFSSTLVLIISAIISPNSNDSDAVQTAFHLLKTMADRGSIPARQYYTRLAHIRRTIEAIRTQANAGLEVTTAPDKPVGVEGPAMPQISASMPESQADLDISDWTSFWNPETAAENYDWTGLGHATADPLDNPLLQTFLDHASWDGNLDVGVEDLTSCL